LATPVHARPLLLLIAGRTVSLEAARLDEAAPRPLPEGDSRYVSRVEELWAAWQPRNGTRPQRDLLHMEAIAGLERTGCQQLVPAVVEALAAHQAFAV
jgi:hypothetical protein